MTTHVIKDYRRNDDNRTLWSPYWLESSTVYGGDLSATTMGLLWSFPASKYGTRKIIIEKIAIQVITAFTGGSPTLDVGAYTLATDGVTTAGVATIVDIDEYIPNANVTAATPAIYWAATGDWITAKLLMTNAAPTVITPANSTVPCIGVLGAASMAAGYARVFMQITEVPFL